MKTEKSKKICGDHVGSRPCKKKQVDDDITALHRGEMCHHAEFDMEDLGEEAIHHGGGVGS
jgi:hypothetical protein